MLDDEEYLVVEQIERRLTPQELKELQDEDNIDLWPKSPQSGKITENRQLIKPNKYKVSIFTDIMMNIYSHFDLHICVRKCTVGGGGLWVSLSDHGNQSLVDLRTHLWKI